MKRYGNLYSQICDMDNLRRAYTNARSGKGWYAEVKEVSKNLDYYLDRLHDMLINKTYKTSKYEMFLRKDRDKIRKIYKLPFFPDRICQWAILQIIEPFLLKNFIYDTYSAIPNKGIHGALNRVKNAVYNHPDECRFCLCLDIKHYYQSINHEILKQTYRSLFKDKDLFWLLDEIIDSINTADEEDLKYIYGVDMLNADKNTGIPIGNYLSQYSGNFYLSKLDHWIKEDKGVKYYFRYMDNLVIFGNSKEDLARLFEEIKKYLYDNLKLKVKQNWQIFPTYIRGIDFVGYRVFKDYTLLRKSTYKNMRVKFSKLKKKLEDGGSMNYSEWCSINSYKGWIKHCDGEGLYAKYISPLEPYAEKFYLENIKSKKKNKEDNN